MSVSGQKGPDGRRARWERHNLTRREHILEAALEALEEAGPGGEVRVEQIARRAGLGRTVVYRHFEDRADLDRAVSTRIIEQLRAQMVPMLSLDGTPVDIIRRIVSAYVGWAAAHPALHRFAERRPGGCRESPMEEAIEQIARQVEDLIGVAAQILEVRLDEDDRAALDPLVFGLVGSVVATCRRWISRPVREPAAEVFVERLTEALVGQVAGTTRRRGVTLDPDQPVEQLLAVAFQEIER